MSAGGDDEPHEEHEEHVNHEAWVIPYADLLTLLMAMFIALFAMSSVDQAKFKKVALGFNEALGGPKLTEGVFSGAPSDSVTGGNGSGGSGDSQKDGNTPGKDFFKTISEQQERLDARRSQQQRTLRDVQKDIEKEARGLGLDKALTFELQERGLVVRVVSDDVLFASGQADLQDDGKAILEIVGKVLAKVDNSLFIEGHTDSQPLAPGAIYQSNWGLSTVRAESVLLYLRDAAGIDEGRMRPTGWADTHPVATNATPEGRAKNRRVEILVQSNVVDELLDANKLGSTPTTNNAPADPNLDEIDKPGL